MRFFAALFALFCLITPAAAAPAFPALTGRVVDDAHILSASTTSDLTARLAALEAKTSRQLVIVTLPSLQGYEISDYGYQLGRHWGIGQKKLNNGVLFIVAPKEHATRIEVGYGLEPILTDAFSSVIIQTQALPHFRKNDFDGGVRAATEALIQQLSLERSEAEARAAAAAKQVQNRQGDDLPGWLVFLIFLGIFGFIFFQSGGGGGPPGRHGGPYYGGGGWPGGGWGGGGFGGGGFGGGGFGGGGGSGGGGGASGRW
ncbi:MAG TPA: TPM domain-containing protein [Rhizomicrobium sp.]|nr:TPM domain-containing protein [Rhizomicrobium sp.]